MNKKQVEEDLRSEFEATLAERADRYLEIGHQPIIGNHYFAPASSECIQLYRDGHFIAVVMMSHAINEAIIQFVAERNQIQRTASSGDPKTLEILIGELKQVKKISDVCATASREICRSYRNDVHHLNPTVTKIKFRPLALENIKRLATIEGEIFGVDFVDGGKLKPRNPIYWDIGQDGYTSAYLRLGS